MWSPGKHAKKVSVKLKAMRRLAARGQHTAAEIAYMHRTGYDWTLKAIADLPYKRTELIREYTRETNSETIFEAILARGDCEDFVPTVDESFQPTDAQPGSHEKIEVMRRRVELGQPVWHEHDRTDSSGIRLGCVDTKYKNQDGTRHGNIRVCPMPKSGGKAFTS